MTTSYPLGADVERAVRSITRCVWVCRAAGVAFTRVISLRAVQVLKYDIVIEVTPDFAVFTLLAIDSFVSICECIVTSRYL